MGDLLKLARIEKQWMIKTDNRLEELLNKDKTPLDDNERKSLFYIIAGNDDLYSKINFIYDFKERVIKPDCFENENVDFCSSSEKLIKLAFALFNSYSTDIYDTFYLLDDKNFDLAIKAIKLRFGK